MITAVFVFVITVICDLVLLITVICDLVFLITVIFVFVLIYLCRYYCCFCHWYYGYFCRFHYSISCHFLLLIIFVIGYAYRVYFLY